MSKIQICVSAFDADESYTDDSQEIVGWTVYARTDPEFDAPFEIDDQMDVETFAAAEFHAAQMAVKYKTDDIRFF